MTRYPLAIVGAGPAGMSAAIVAAEAGLRPLLIDENPRIGGQIYRQPSPHLQPNSAEDSSHAERGALHLRRLRDLGDRVAFLLGSTVWGLFPTNRLTVDRGGKCETVEADHVILAPGAYEYVPPFPGWTLPGVMTPGAAQLLVKTMQVRPGQRALLAGTGPFLLVVAEALHRAETVVAGVVEMARRREAWRALPGLLACPGLLWEGLRYLHRLRRAGIPVYRGHVLLEARGDQQAGEALIAPCDVNGQPDRARSRTIEVDTICVSYGFVPRTQLAQLAGCRLRFDEALGGWIPEVDENLQTSVPRVWVAGDGGGVAGALVADLEGTLAGLAVARHLNAISETQFAQRKSPIVARLARLRRFRNALDWLYRRRPGLIDLAKPETIVCRCEEVTRGEVETAIAAGAAEFRSLKTATRAGMGPCQGAMCGPALCRFLGARTGRHIEQIGPPNVRPPIVPVALGGFADQGGTS